MGQECHIFGLNATDACKHSIPFFRRHCLLAEMMERWNESDFFYVIDSDVIANVNEGDWQWDQEESSDLIFYERWWNGEVVAGGYGVKNNQKTRQFLHMWANLENGQPTGKYQDGK